MFAAKADEPAPVRLVDLVDQLETAARLKRPLRRGAPSTARQADTAAPTRRRG